MVMQGTDAEWEVFPQQGDGAESEVFPQQALVAERTPSPVEPLLQGIDAGSSWRALDLRSSFLTPPMPEDPQKAPAGWVAMVLDVRDALV